MELPPGFALQPSGWFLSGKRTCRHGDSIAAETRWSARTQGYVGDCRGWIPECSMIEHSMNSIGTMQ